MCRLRLLRAVGVLVALAAFQGPGAACWGQQLEAVLRVQPRQIFPGMRCKM
jgi:hypothetical protein